MGRSTESNYTVEKVRNFLSSVKMAIERGGNCQLSFQQICKLFRFGQITLPALRDCEFIVTNGRGFENWTWALNRPVNDADIKYFIFGIERQKELMSKKRNPKAIHEIKPSNLVNFKPAKPQKAVQAELPMHPARLTILNKIYTEMLVIRMRIEKIEDFIDEQSAVKTAGR